MKCFKHEIGKVCPDCGLDRRQELIDRIADALGTAECGEALIEVARNAHRAEMELASTINWNEMSIERDLEI